MKKASIALPVILSFVFLAAGCSSKPSTADMMRGHATELNEQVQLKKQLAKDWETGNKMIRDNEKAIRQAERDEAKAQRDLKQAQNAQKKAREQLAAGTQLKLESERQFSELFPASAL